MAAIVFFYILFISAPAGFFQYDGEYSKDRFREQMADYLDRIEENPGEERIFNPGLIRQIYVEDNGITGPKWDSRVNIEQLLNSIHNTQNHGLRPDDYHIKEIQSLIDFDDYKVSDSARLDLLLTDSFLLLSAHMASGKTESDTTPPRWNALEIMPEFDWKGFLQNSLAESRIYENIEQLAPEHPMYKDLKEVLKQYRNSEEDGESLTYPAGANEKTAMIRGQLERWRRMGDPGDHYIMVNIPAFDLYIVRNDIKMLTSKVVVGQPERQTPAFSSYLTEVEFNPFWIIPPGMLSRDIIPAVKDDVFYLENNNMEVLDKEWDPVDPLTVDWEKWYSLLKENDTDFPFVIRQKPGPDNEMGSIKFIMPNPYYVVIHDTPHRHLFDSDRRDFSSGCVRVEKPLRLAEYVFEKLTLTQIFEIIYRNEFEKKEIENPIPVHITYFTLLVGEKGEVNFYEDIYNFDPPLIKAMEEPPPWLLPGQNGPEKE